MAGCSKKSTEAGEEAVIIKSLYAPSSVQKGKTGTVDVEVKDDKDNSVSGVRVSFSVSPASIGYFTPIMDTTDENGLAASVFTATGLGTATIQVGAEGAQSKTAEIEIVSAGETTKPIEIEITPGWLPADGISTSTVKATIRDSTGSLVKNGTIVKFVAGEDFGDVDGDGYYTEGVDQLKYDTNGDGKWNPIGIIAAYASTQNGIVQVTYTAGLRTGTAYIKVTTGPAGRQVQDYNTILLVPTDTVGYIVLTSDYSSIQVKSTGGVEATQVTATCYDNNGNRVDKDFPVEFYIISGPGGGENLDGKDVYPVTINTNTYGEAHVTLSSSTKSGTVRMRAKVGNILSTSTVVTICAGPPSDISIGVTPCNIRGWDVNCVEANICACVVDVYGNPVPDSTAVHFSTEEGMVYCCDRTEKGCAYSKYLSGDPRNDGLATIWAETESQTGIVRDSTVLIVSGPPASVTFRSYPHSLLADGISKGDVVVEVLDVNDNFVVAQTPVKMKTNFGSVADGMTSDGCYASIYETELISEVLNQDYSLANPNIIDDGIGVVNVLTAKSGFVSASVYVTFYTGSTYRKNCEIDMEDKVPHGATVPIGVLIKDRYGNPLGGHKIVSDQSQTTNGIITGIGYTNAFGEATGFTFTASTDISLETAIITLCDQDLRGGVCLAKKIALSED
jgi:adhesin/invasin